MNAMQIASNSKPQTIGELIQYLQALKDAWTPEDAQYLGQFEDQPLYLGVDQQGIGRAFMQYHAEFGLIAFDMNS